MTATLRKRLLSKTFKKYKIIEVNKLEDGTEIWIISKELVIPKGKVQNYRLTFKSDDFINETALDLKKQDENCKSIDKYIFEAIEKTIIVEEI